MGYVHGLGDVLIVPGHQGDMREGGSGQKEQARQKQCKIMCGKTRFHEIVPGLYQYSRFRLNLRLAAIQMMNIIF